ncbi:hypothetical protein LNP17_14250 [Klebsiella variicola subsp. variicola]|nr:hypothetical protein [Klebsiella variicola subsp. variicola]
MLRHCIAKVGTVFTVRWWRSSGNIRRAGDDVVFVSGSMTDILWPAMAALGGGACPVFRAGGG